MSSDEECPSCSNKKYLQVLKAKSGKKYLVCKKCPSKTNPELPLFIRFVKEKEDSGSDASGENEEREKEKPLKKRKSQSQERQEKKLTYDERMDILQKSFDSMNDKMDILLQNTQRNSNSQ